MIIGVDKEAPGYSRAFSGWTFYEYGYPESQHGLAASAAPTNRTFTSIYKATNYNQSVQFTFQPYTEKNVLFVSEVNEEQTLTLAHPTRFYALQFLLTSRTATWFARLNFSDGSSVETPTYEDVDWISGGTPDNTVSTTAHSGIRWRSTRSAAPSCSRSTWPPAAPWRKTGMNGYAIRRFHFSIWNQATTASPAHRPTINSGRRTVR